jgi:hypothetical protein
MEMKVIIMADPRALQKEAVLDAAQMVDTTYLACSTFAMPKELRVALNTLHQRVRALMESYVTGGVVQYDLSFKENP